MKKIKQQYIFWCYERDHCEDWFIQASSKEEAAGAHDCFEGFNEGDSKAIEVCEVPAHLHLKEVDYPKESTLKKLGFEYIQSGTPRIVRFKGKIYRERTIMDTLLVTAEQYNEPHVYLIGLRGQNKFKIGFTTNLSQRIKSLQTSLPFHIDLYDTISSDSARIIEGEIQEMFSAFRLSKEWVHLNKFSYTCLALVFEAYKTEIKLRTAPYIATEFFPVLMNEYKQLVAALSNGKKPPYFLKNRLEMLSSMNAEREKNVVKKLSTEVYRNEKYKLNSKVKHLKERYIKENCKHKVDDIITVDKVRYKISEIHVYDNADKSLDKPYVKFAYSGYKINKDNSLSKYYHHYIFYTT